MATQTLWPNVGVSELAEDGVTPITTDGIVVTLVQDTPVSALKLPDYYAVRVARSRLLTYDPLALGGDPTTVPPLTRVSAALVGVLTSQLASRAGIGDGETIVTTGYTTALDGGGAQWKFAAGVSAGAGLANINTSNGQWQLVWDGLWLHADWLGIPRDGVTDALAGLTAALGLTTKAYTLKLGPGTYRITGQLTVPVCKTIVGTTGADGGLHSSYSVGQDNSTLIVYDGSTLKGIADCAISVNTGVALKDLNVVPAIGKHVTSLIAVKTEGATTILFENVGLNCYRGLWSNGASGRGTTDYGYILGPNTANQCDFVRWTRGFVISPRKAAIAIAGAQPFNIVVDYTRFNNFLGNDLPGGAKPHGSIFEMVGAGGFCDVSINNGENEYFACVFRNFGTTFVSCSVRHMASEGLKRLWDQPGFAELSGTCSFIGGRYDTISAGKAVYDIDTATDAVTLWLADTDHRFLRDRAGTAFSLIECNIGQGGSANDLAADCRAELNLHNTFTAIGCTFPNTSPVYRGSENGGTTNAAGGVHLQGCRGYVAASTTRPIAERHGPINPDGYAVVADAATFVDVTFTVPELGQNGLGPAGSPRYLVHVYPIDSSGTPAAAAFRSYVSAIATTGFRINVEAAPTAGKSVTFAYRLSLNPQGV